MYVIVLIWLLFSDAGAKKHLERYLYGVQGLSSEVPHILNVCLLAVQCMEVSTLEVIFTLRQALDK